MEELNARPTLTSKQLEPCPLASKDTSSNRSAMESESHSKIRCVGSETDLELFGQSAEFVEAVTSESRHHNSVVFSGVGKAGHCYITVPHCFDFEYAAPFRDFVEGMVPVEAGVRGQGCNTIEALSGQQNNVHCFKQSEDLAWLASGTPCTNAL